MVAVIVLVVVNGLVCEAEIINIVVVVEVPVIDVLVITALECPVSTPLKEFSRPLALLGCATPFDCRPLALLDCTRVLQAQMPSYHV